jgi:transposase
MTRPRRVESDLVEHAKNVVSQTQDIRELRMAQAVLLPALAQLTLEQTATVLGIGRASVARFQRRFRRYEGKSEAKVSPWGGRRRALMSLEEEKKFLADWKVNAEHGELVVLTPLRAAFEKKLGRQVKPSVVYRMLQRHDWRKVAPDTRHPKAKPAVQDEWKKKRFRKSWRPC